MRLFVTSLMLLLMLPAFSQLNIDSLGRLEYSTLHNTKLNDVWGYVDEMGNEYALVGAEDGTSVVNVTDPANPAELFWEPGMYSVWRDLKTWGDYAFVTTEALNGLLIIDLSPLPASTTLPVAYYSGGVGQEWQSAHNLYIDENGYAYIYGANRGNGGVIILDVHTDPMNPVEVGEFDDWYVHDGYTRGDTMYLGHINDGFMSMVDVTDKANPVLLGTAFTPSTFTHNVWPSGDSQYAFTTDEVSGGYIGSYDVSDPSNIVEVDRIQSSPGSGVIPHNAHVLNDFIVTSYYADGVTIHDATYPYNLIEVGNYDTYPLQTPGFDGCWGAYPFFPSGNLLATDRTEGLFILGPTYTQAAYLEGIITDATNSNPIDGVMVDITGYVQSDNSNSNGFYATGMPTGGTYTVLYDKVGYYPETYDLTITNGVVITHDVDLTPIPPYAFEIEVVEQGTMNPVPDAFVKLTVPQITHESTTNGIGKEQFTLFYQDVYQITVGKWGYITRCVDMQIDNSTGTITIEIKPGYYDDFTFHQGWVAGGTASTGLWERGEPYALTDGAAPSADVLGDCGDKAFVTGNEETLDIDGDDVDDGLTYLFSPIIDLSGYSDPYLNYKRWFYCFHGPQAPDDTLEIAINNGSTEVIVDKVGSVHPDNVDWVEKSIRILDHISLTAVMQVRVRVSDVSGSANITEAAFDHFYIVEENELSTEEIQQELRIYPNPAMSVLNIEGLNASTDYAMYGMNGRLIKKGEIGAGESQIDLNDVTEGVYFLNLNGVIHKIVKVN